LSDTPTAKVKGLDDTLLRQLDAAAEYARKDQEAVWKPGPRPWFVPADPEGNWSGDLFALEELNGLFSREDLGRRFDEATDPESPGVSGDLMAVQLQGDYLATMERAYRNRIRTSVRNKIHAAARRKGQSGASGVIIRGQRGFLERLLKGSNPET